MGTARRAKQALVDLGVIDHAEHSRKRVYPQAANVALRLTPPAFVDTFSAWVPLIPVGVVTIPYSVTGLIPENTFGPDLYFVELATSPTPTSDQYIGQFRFRLGDPATYLATMAPLIVRTGEISSGGGVWGRIKAASAAGQWVDFSLILTTWLRVANPVPLYPFPW